MSYKVMDEEVPKPLWCRTEILTLPSPALTVIISTPKPLTGQHSLINLLSLFKRKWETSLKQPQKSLALPSHTDIHQDCSNFTWLSLCGPQAPAQELILKQEAQQNSCRREIPAYQSVQATSLQQPTKEPGKSVQPSFKAFPHHRCQPTTAGLTFHQCQQEKEE